MVLISFGIIAMIVLNVMSNASPSFSKLGRIGYLVGFVLIVLGVISSCFVQITAGSVGVQSLFGKIQGKVLTEGLNVVNPIMSVIKFDVKTQNYTMSAVHDEGDQSGDDAIRVLSADGLEVVLDLTVLYRVTSDKAPTILRTIGEDYTQVVVRPIVRTKIRDLAANYDAVALYSSKREEFQQRLFTAVDKEFSKRGFSLEQVLIRNLNLPQSVKAAIESKINAEQESQKMRFVLDKERQEADRKRVEAQGISDYQRILTSTLTDKLLQYEKIKAQKELAGSPNAKIIIMDGKNTPMIMTGN
ncbi:prohibitin family protein [Haliscomenobacter hydrossis]|uniref:Band 7 protein n=1 Tax=Haliscomenobacter hydrossis (strain ATCC 27775 / DSM 1100 / LMG 10767 / O) TaxID=760192 RepID=F4L2B1_HALH1|nr:prohibitin family protein [Haliscomenobacter hydrossis]AEE52864.1 band 7 protein [Haliscomenobacter hydrossis DSM 1100]